MDTMAVLIMHQADERKKAVPSIGFRSVQLIQSIRKQAACLTFFSAKSGSSCCVAHSLKRGFRFAKGAIVECRDSSLSGICSHSGSHFVKSSRRHPYPFNPKPPIHSLKHPENALGPRRHRSASLDQNASERLLCSSYLLHLGISLIICIYHAIRCPFWASGFGEIKDITCGLQGKHRDFCRTIRCICLQDDIGLSLSNKARAGTATC